MIYDNLEHITESYQMATEKTPAHKRIKRAEIGRNDWKLKATERREEIVKLQKEL